jgi:hypothetical protein
MPKPSNAKKQVKTHQGSSPSADVLASHTPPSSPVLESVEPTVTFAVKDLTHALVKALKSHGVITSTKAPVPAESRSKEHVESKKEIRRASKLEFQIIDEMYVTKSSR